jgi:hypothetical protein
MTSAPVPLQKIVIRFFEPIFLGVVAVIWHRVIQSTLSITVFTVSCCLLLLGLLYRYIRDVENEKNSVVADVNGKEMDPTEELKRELMFEENEKEEEGGEEEEDDTEDHSMRSFSLFAESDNTERVNDVKVKNSDMSSTEEFRLKFLLHSNDDEDSEKDEDEISEKSYILDFSTDGALTSTNNEDLWSFDVLHGEP